MADPALDTEPHLHAAPSGPTRPGVPGRQRAGFGTRPSRVPRPERPIRPDRGLFDSGPRFVVIVSLLAAVTTGPSIALALAGRTALEGTNGPATTPMMAAAPAAGSVLVQGVAMAGPPSQSLSVAQRDPAELSPVPAPRHAPHRLLPE
jgi:hypothetical protein